MIVVISIVTICVVCTLVAAAILFLRKYSSTRGDYYTQVRREGLILEISICLVFNKIIGVEWTLTSTQHN